MDVACKCAQTSDLMPIMPSSHCPTRRDNILSSRGVGRGVNWIWRVRCLIATITINVILKVSFSVGLDRLSVKRLLFRLHIMIHSRAPKLPRRDNPLDWSLISFRWPTFLSKTASSSSDSLALNNRKSLRTCTIATSLRWIAWLNHDRVERNSTVTGLNVRKCM